MAGRIASGRAQHALFQEGETVYREVRRSLETHKHFREADRFAVRELEMRRLAYLGTPGFHWWDRFWGQTRANFLTVPALYLLFGGYGQSIRRPAFWLVLVLLALGPWLMNWMDTAAFPSGWTGYMDGVVRPMRTVALLPDLPTPPGGTPPPPPAPLRQVVEVLLRVAGPFFALLFAIAVRRQVRR